jgi:hypothetical protein
MGTYTATVAPAMNPQGVPDPLLTKVGQWSVQTTSQSSFKSGVPASAAAGDDHDASGDGSADSGETKDHWLGVVIEDTEGNPLTNQFVSIELPNGEGVDRTLGDSGAVRLDTFVIDENQSEPAARVKLVFDASRAPVKTVPDGFLAVQLVDDDGEPLAARDVVLTLPDGRQLARTLNELGRTRFEGIPLGAACSLDLVPAQAAQ